MRKWLKWAGYFNAVEAGMFVDSGMFPERNNDGIARKIDGGIGSGHDSKARKRLHGPRYRALRL